eukprot:404669_1
MSKKQLSLLRILVYCLLTWFIANVIRLAYTMFASTDPYTPATATQHSMEVSHRHIPQKNIALPTNARCKHKGKVFVIGVCKTGTKTLKAMLRRLGYRCNRNTTEMERACQYLPLSKWYKDVELINGVGVDDISWLFHSKRLYDLIALSTYRTLQSGDLPWAFLYPVFDKWYPNSKYILTVRSSTYDVLNSEMKQRVRANKWRVNATWQHTYMVLARRYEMHNQNVKQYFRSMDKLQDLLVIDVHNESKQEIPYKRIVEFLGCDLDQHKHVQLPKRNVHGHKQADFFPRNYTFDWRTFASYHNKYRRIFQLLDSQNRHESVYYMDDEKWNRLKHIYEPLD